MNRYQLMERIDGDRGGFGDPVQGREILARHIQPLVLTPTDDGYQITGAFDLATVIQAANAGVSENGSRRGPLRVLDIAGSLEIVVRLAG